MIKAHLAWAAAAFLAILPQTSAGAQQLSEFMIPTADSFPSSIAVGSDGALWFTERQGNKIGRITVSGSITEFLLPTPGSFPSGIAAGPDGALWFTESAGNKIGRITVSGAITEFSIPTPSAGPAGIAVGSDGALWFTEFGAAGNKIGRITISGHFSEFALPSSGSGPLGITLGPDGALWFTETFIPSPGGGLGFIGRITTTGAITEFRTGNPSCNDCSPIDIAPGADGALWFTRGSNAIGRITTAGIVANFTTPSAADTTGITSGPDGALWFQEARGPINNLARIGTAGGIQEFILPPPITFVRLAAPGPAPNSITTGPDEAIWLVDSRNNAVYRFLPPTAQPKVLAAVLPSSRSVQIGNTATAFATIINASGGAASGCAPAPLTALPANFAYQTTDPATNALTGTPNTPAALPAGKPQSFVIAFAPNAPMVPIVANLGFSCSGLDAAPSNPGVNRLLYSASASPVPDIVALAATTQNDGILHVPGASGSGAFAVASVNIGAGGPITVNTKPGATTLPLGITICQTNPSSGQCLAPPAASVSTTISPNATPTFGIFASGQGTSVPFLPASNRIFVEFRDPGGTVRGSTSVAVATQ